MNSIQIFAMIASIVIPIVASFIGVMFWFISDMRIQIGRVDSDIKAQGERTDNAMARIDKLYTMFVDLLKDRKSK